MDELVNVFIVCPKGPLFESQHGLKINVQDGQAV
jgi:hypothetical protein